MHARFSPRAHRFAYRIFLFAFDLDELDALHRKLRFFSFRRPNFYSFRESDYLPTHENLPAPIASAPGHTPAATAGLKGRVTGFLAAHGVNLAGGRVVLVTLPRVLGYLFNPVSFYYCYDCHGAPVATVAEVTNTFKEMKPYLLGPHTQSSQGVLEMRTPKFFYVSPFSDVDVAFDFALRPLAERLSVQIDDYAGTQRTLTSTLVGKRQRLTNARLAWFTLKYPLITLKIIALIHWHALVLWARRVPWFAKASRPADQRALYRPHISLQPVATPAAAHLPDSAAAARVDDFCIPSLDPK